MKKYALRYSSKKESESRFLDDLAEILQRHGIVGKDYHDISVALSEAFNNACEHGNKYDPDRRVFVTIQVNEQSISADIEDEGVNGLNRVKSRPSPEPMSESGRGVDLITHYAAEVRFGENSSGGLKVTVKFERESIETS